MSLNVVDAVASTPNLCEHFHVPFQSGDDDVLRDMGRSVPCHSVLTVVDWCPEGSQLSIRLPHTHTHTTRHASGYTVAKYMEIVDRIRAVLPDAAVTADVIVGFPGETEEQFQNSLKLMETVKFDQLNTATYR